MKRKTLWILLLLSAGVASRAQTNYDGKDWRGMSASMRVGYISGFIDATVAAGAWSMPAEEIAAGKINRERVAKAEANAREQFPFNLKTGDVIDGLDRFYDEPANRRAKSRPSEGRPEEGRVRKNHRGCGQRKN